MTTSYWDRVTRERVSRRRLLKAGASLSMGAAALAVIGCGDDDDDDDGAGTPASPTSAPSGGGAAQPTAPAETDTGLVRTPTDETGNAVQGGVYLHNHGDLEFTIDPITMLAPTNAALVAMVYSHFVKYGRKLPPDVPTAADIEGDALASWEFAGDGMSVTYKLRPNQKFDPRPPTNGRVMTVEDIKYSFDATAAQGPLGGTIYAAAGEGGHLTGLDIIDNETVRITTDIPYGAINEALAYVVQYVAPVEGEDQFDRASQMRGSGPFRLDNLEEGISADFSRNSDYYVQNQPFLDGMRYFFIGEDAVENAQFVAKQLWKILPGNPLDTLDIKKRFPEVLMQAEPPRLTPASYGITLGRNFHQDVRLRRAASMLIDREAMIGAVRNTEVWTNEGIDIYIRWDTHLSSQSPNWLDPKGDGLGEGAQFFQFNPAEAKKLMDAAGYAGEELPFYQRANFQPDQTAILSQMLRDGGFNIVDVPEEASAWRERKFSGPGTYDGFFFNTYIAGFNDEGFLVDKYITTSRDHTIPEDLPWLRDALAGIVAELDAERKNERIKEFQRELAMEMLDVPSMSLQPTSQFDLTWPWLRNTAWAVPGFNFWGSSARPQTVFWVDSDLLKQFGG